MDVQIRYHNMTEKEELGEYIERRLSQALDRFQRRIRRVMMHVYDLNGPRGGVDKRCLALVQLKSGGELAFELRDADAFSAVDRLSDKLKERLGRELAKQRSKRSHACDDGENSEGRKKDKRSARLRRHADFCWFKA